MHKSTPALAAEPSLAEIKQLVETLRDELRCATSGMAAHDGAVRRSACFDHAPIGLFLASLDGKLLVANAALARSFGYQTAADMLAATPALADLLAEPRNYAPLLVDLYRDGAASLPETTFKRIDGSCFAASLTLATAPGMSDAGSLTAGAVLDFAGPTLRDAACVTAENDFKTLFEQAAEGIFKCTPTGEILVANQALADIFGYASVEDVLLHAPSLASDVFSEPSRFDELARRLRRDHAVNKFVTMGVRSDRSLVWLNINAHVLHSQDGQALLFQGSVQDATDLKKVESRLLHESFYDSLTGLVNRPMFLNLLDKSIARAKRRNSFSFGLVVMSINRFRAIKESLGHVLAETLLGMVSRIMLQCLRTEDICARLGGDEFALFLSDVQDISDAVRVIERINTSLQEPLQVEGTEVFATVSSGIVVSCPEYSNAENMLNDADTAMYRAASDPTLLFAVFNEAMQKEAIERLKVETDLRKALARDEFRLHYQPIVSLATGEIAGFEALMRWERPEVGLAPPDFFISLLEHMGLIVATGEWVLREACKQTRRWQKQYPKHQDLMISVNISPKQLAAPGLVDQVRAALAESGLSAASLKLEITESLLMERPEDSCATLEELKALGVGSSIDDFGTGYSSLAYLSRLPADYLKIDKSFIREIQDLGSGSEIVRAIVALAHTLNKRVVAEGVETSQQLSLLMQLQCEYVQGYYFSKPIPHRDVEMLLAIGLRP